MRLSAGEHDVVIQPERADLALEGAPEFPGTDDGAESSFLSPGDLLEGFNKILLAFDGLQVPYSEDDLPVLRKIERPSALCRVTRMEEIAPEAVGYNCDRCGDVQFPNARKIALADGDDVICGVEHVLDLLPPFMILKGKGVYVITVPGDNEGGAILFFEASTGVAGRPGEVGVDEIKLCPTFLQLRFDVRIMSLSQIFVASICGDIPDRSWIHMRILRGTDPVYFIHGRETLELRNREKLPQSLQMDLSSQRRLRMTHKEQLHRLGPSGNYYKSGISQPGLPHLTWSHGAWFLTLLTSIGPFPNPQYTTPFPHLETGSSHLRSPARP